MFQNWIDGFSRAIDSPVIDVSAFRLLLLVLTGWLERREREAIAYLVEENPLLYRQ